MTAKKRGLGKGLDALLGVGSDVNLTSSREQCTENAGDRSCKEGPTSTKARF